ncbi:MAG: maltooligosyl trehalose synthase [Acidobacteriales bacterium]|nr:maltooligosyl trehalose synthase [Terriglobales bacterium]
MRTNVEILTAQSSGLTECLDRMAAHKRESRPLSTYRLQFHKSFRFADATKLLPYLHSLGISHVYSSPILKARAGSTHGYDITDHNLINPEIGTEAEFHEFVGELKRLNMGQILDAVPNHMGIGMGDNPWWRDVLENGQASEYADFFDIDWDPLKSELRDKLLLPILGNQYGEELEEGRIQLAYETEFLLRYYDKAFPIDPQTIPLVFESLLAEAPTDPDIRAFDATLGDLRNLPLHSETNAEAVARRRALAPQLLKRLVEIIDSSDNVRRAVHEAIVAINGHPGNSASYDALHRLLEAQAYRLAHWRVSAEEINYRRFFDINELVGLRMENPKVFAETHRLMRRLLSDGSISGVRIDHCDGLLNPRQYLIRLQMLFAASQCCGPEPHAPVSENGIELELQTAFGQHNWMGQHAPLYTVVEKILEPGEQLPIEWPVDGTSGYDFANLVNGIFIQQANERAFTNTYARFIGGLPDFESILYGSKKLIMNTALSSEVNVLAHMLDEISSSDRHARDFTRKALRDAIRETIACFPIYRSYIDERGEITERDRRYIHQSVAIAKRRNAGTASAVFDFLRSILLLESDHICQSTNGRNGVDGHPGTSEARRNGNASDDTKDQLYYRKLQFTLKFQQLTGPVMAKGLEDTASYVYNRFVSVNEVGGSPKLFGHPVQEFHRGNLIRAEHWPFSMLATSTHDTKRSEDVRSRLDVLSELPRQWSASAMRWRRTNASKKRVLTDGRTVPDLNEEYLLYQTLVGAWPLRIETDEQRQELITRIQEYMAKALHEAKVNLSWINPDPEYIAATNDFIARILTPGTRNKSNLFLESIETFLPAVQYFGLLNSLAQAILKITSPGVPDIYQGTELWDFSLVDPDNRRPVDFEQREKFMRELSQKKDSSLLQVATGLLADLPADEGLVKLYINTRALQFRRENPELFRLAPYIPIEVTGDKRDHVVAFARTSPPNQMAIVAAPLFAHTLMKGRIAPPTGDVWADTELSLPENAPDSFENVLTGEILNVTNRRTLLLKEIFANFPVALLTTT